MKTFGIYDEDGMALDAIGAKTAAEALAKYRRKHNLTESQMKGIWAEDLTA